MDIEGLVDFQRLMDLWHEAMRRHNATYDVRPGLNPEYFVATICS